jgi:O-antigen/teichoic acid export membrane protein
MILRKYINNLNALQTVNLLRFISFFVISILLVKTGYSKSQIGEFEMTILIANAVSFFWVYGIIHSLMTLYNNNNSFSNITKNRKSPEIFNAFLLLSTISFVIFLILLACKIHMNMFGDSIKKFPYLHIVLLNILFLNPASLIEYIYILRNKPLKTLSYGIMTYSLLLLSVSLTLIFKLNIEIALWCLACISFLRFIWLVALLKKYAEFKFSLIFIKEHLKLAYPLILGYLLSGSAEYIDNLIISIRFDFDTLATFRYGAKELPFSTSMANGLNSSMIAGFATEEKTRRSIALLKEKSKRLMHILFPISILILLMSDILYPFIYRSDFGRSSDFFMVYLLLITSRLLFPQTILIGLKQTSIVLKASFFTLILNIIISLILLPYRGAVGVVAATVISYFIEKVILMWYVYRQYKIKPTEYTPVSTYLIYSFILLLIFTLIDHKIIQF